jgi:2-dehydropantoate 2-reductase
MAVAIEGKTCGRERMKTDILIVGSGALATFFAARLSASGAGITMLGTWPDGMAALGKNGAYLEGQGSFPVRVTGDPVDCGGVKYALILVKSWQTERVGKQLAKCLAEDGLAVTFQNGLGNAAILADILGRKRVSQGVTTLGATLIAPGSVRPGGGGEVVLEARLGLEELESTLRIANFKVKVVDDILPVAWGKLVINAAINPLTALLRVKNGDLLTNPMALELMGDLADEAARVAKSIGVTIPFSTPKHAAEKVAQHTSENISSMLQDILRGAQTEVDAINGAIVNTGMQMNIPTPANRVVWLLVKALLVHDKI